MLGLDVDTVVPGHGPLTDKAGIVQVRDYLAFVDREASARQRAGLDAWDAARELAREIGAREDFGSWGEFGRIAVNVETVYRTLDLLGELGLLRPVYQGTGAAHYVLLLDGHHHHLVCSRCRRVIEFDECALAELAETVGRRYGFAVEGHLLEFYGRCSQCAALS